MAQILDSRTGTFEVPGEGGETTKKEGVTSVTFIDQNQVAHTLVFHPEGTDVSGDQETEPRIVGEHVPAYYFKTPEEAIAAYENGDIR